MPVPPDKFTSFQHVLDGLGLVLSGGLTFVHDKETLQKDVLEERVEGSVHHHVVKGKDVGGAPTDMMRVL